MSGNKNTYGFPQTTTTLIDRLRVGGKEDWTEFWKRYEGPIKNTLRSKMRDKSQLDYNEAEAYISVVFQRIQSGFGTYVHHGKSKFRDCIIRHIRDAIAEEVRAGKKYGWKNTVLTLDREAENNSGQKPSLINRIESDGKSCFWCKDFGDVDNEDVDLELLSAFAKFSLKQAANRFPWGGDRKEIVKLLATTDLSVGEIAKLCHTESYNVSKAKEELIKKAKKYFDAYVSDDSEYFEDVRNRFRLSGLNVDEIMDVIATRIDTTSAK